MKKRMITGITPSGKMTLGNYLGVVKNLIDWQDEYDLFVFIANLHAITLPQNPKQLKQNTEEIAALYLAAGLNPENVVIFKQSEVPAHSELGWLLNTQTSMGELSRMTQFKDKSQKLANKSSIPAGLFNYPTLMAADILLYEPDFVPVGVDQKQHVELARDLALRFNNKYGENFKVPEPLLTKNKIKIMDLQDPTKKMSKSSLNPKAVLYILDEPAIIRKKIASALTDSENVVRYDPENKPGVSNLMTIYALLKNTTPENIEHLWEGKNYKDFKDDVAEEIIAILEPIQKNYQEIKRSGKLETILNEGALRANRVAQKKVTKTRKKMGLN
ncbi:tryptophanyl-tRNA synthetase [Entomoplasma freundtii]|uniref:Tryptophan--tRNA ligase n=1 Tax=Entomoplasma freundtii TaxID=74700 RepID=A0A2K8NS14_9MOLU|nr:tryptophan--tRNA ligase [Entomoplasma freundtii]ATZ16567.1 tryptophanyl-tRNA synthetase [Entomoplasma freundtii]TDY58267.1 tryptophanyl-tRNA synthetase [Entomoplasma freundtii]